MSKLCTEFYENLTYQYNDKSYIFMVAPEQMLGNDSDFLLLNEPKYKELIYSKKIFGKLFKVIQSQQENDTWNAYYISIILFIMTAENKTNFISHRKLFYQLYKEDNYSPRFLIKELRLVERLLHCNLNRTNKSSSLWRWYKELFVLIAEHGLMGHLDLLIFNKSGEKHFANYYAWNCCRWCFDNLSSDKFKFDLMNNVQTFCFSHLSDSSSWNAFSYMILQRNKLEKDMYNALDYARLAKKINTDNSFNNETRINKFADNKTLFKTLEQTIDMFFSTINTVMATQFVPFLYLINILNSTNYAAETHLNNWKLEVQNFEENHGQIIIKNGIYPEIDPNLEREDLIAFNKYKHLGNKKVFLIKLNKWR